MVSTFSNLPLILSISALLGTVYALWQMASLNKLRKTFFAGNKALNLESVIEMLGDKLKNSEQRQQFLEAALSQIQYSTSFSIQKVGMVRFNPFSDGGGNFSFSLALLDAHNNGIVITSMYGREQNRIYAKKIENGQSDNQLNQEEVKAVELANAKS